MIFQDIPFLFMKKRASRKAKSRHPQPWHQLHYAQRFSFETKAEESSGPSEASKPRRLQPEWRKGLSRRDSHHAAAGYGVPRKRILAVWISACFVRRSLKGKRRKWKKAVRLTPEERARLLTMVCLFEIIISPPVCLFLSNCLLWKMYQFGESIVVHLDLKLHVAK